MNSLPALIFVFGIFHFSSIISISIISSISSPFSEFKSDNNLQHFYPVVFRFNSSISFISVSNLSI